MSVSPAKPIRVSLRNASAHVTMGVTVTPRERGTIAKHQTALKERYELMTGLQDDTTFRMGPHEDIGSTDHEPNVDVARVLQRLDEWYA